MHSNDEGMGESVGGEGAERSVSRASGVEAVETLTNEALLVGTRRLVCQSNRVLATLLAHLGEVEARGLHRTRACASLYIYCIYELRMSEDAVYRRVVAARLVKRFPALFGAVERGELHLTALVLLAPHLTEANVGDVVARAKFRTKKEISKLVRLLSPLPDVPSRIEPLGLERRPASRATWSNTTQRWVRELEPDARPDNWLAPQEATAISEDAVLVESALARSDPADVTEPCEEKPPEDAPARSEGVETTFDYARTSVGDARTSLDGPQRLKVQFTANEEYVALVEEAKALLSHSLPRADLAEIHRRAMRNLVAELKRRKYATTARRARAATTVGAPAAIETRAMVGVPGTLEPAPDPSVRTPNGRDADRRRAPCRPLATEQDFGAELAIATRNGYSHFTERSVSQAD
jgi:hypothetical protein